MVEVGTRSAPIWREALGRLQYAPGAAEASEDTVFDLASLTKVLATAPLVMRQVERGELALDAPLSRYLPAWRGADRDSVTVRDLLSHCGGLAGHVPLFRTCTGRAAFESAITSAPLAYPPRTRAVYSDLGFMLLGFLLDDILPLALQFDAMRGQMGGIADLQFCPPAAWQPRIAPTSVDPWRGRLLVGEVEDENAWALGGVAGHAGLFGTVGAVGACARHCLQVLEGGAGAISTEILREFVTRRSDVPGSTRALGWDTMEPTSSCGTRMSPRAFGHTGFTGTSLWIDPDRSLYVALLTNRVHPSRGNDAIAGVRPALHDAIVEAVDRG